MELPDKPGADADERGRSQRQPELNSGGRRVVYAAVRSTYKNADGCLAGVVAADEPRAAFARE